MYFDFKIFPREFFPIVYRYNASTVPAELHADVHTVSGRCRLVTPGLTANADLHRLPESARCPADAALFVGNISTFHQNILGTIELRHGTQSSTFI